MKRVISFVLTVALLFGLVGTTGLTVFADEQPPEITESIRLSGLPQMIQPGTAEIPQVTVEKGDCYVDGVQWMTTEKEPVTSFEKDKAYYLAITLETDTHVFSDYVDTYMWDLYAAYQEDYDIVGPQTSVAYYYYEAVDASNGFTEYASISFPDYYPGDPVPAVPEVTAQGATISELEWRIEDGSDQLDTYFVEDKEYHFTLIMNAPEGAPFAPGAMEHAHILGAHNGSGIYYSEDFTEVRVSVYLRPHFESMGSASLVGVPWNAEVGPAVAPQIDPEYDHITVGQVYWTDMEENPVTTLEEGKTYYLAVEVLPAENHVFSEYTSVYTDAREVDHYDRISRTQMVVYMFYSLEPDAGNIIVDMSGLAEGASIADFAPVVYGNAVLQKLKIYNLTTGQNVTDGVFEPNCNYSMEVVLEAKDGYRFVYPNLEVSPYDPTGYGHSYYTLSFTYNFSTCQIVETVEVSVVPPVPGGKVSDAVATVDPDAPYTIKDYYWLDSNWDEIGDTFEAGKDYDLMLTVAPKTGYAFDGGKTNFYINGEYEGWSFEGNEIDATVSCTFTFGVQSVYLEGLPYEIKAGTAKVPTVTDALGEVTVTKTRWVNTSKNKVTSFTNGKVYFLEVTLKPNNGKVFDTQLDPDFFLVDGSPAEWKYNSAQELVLYYKYSLEPEVGDVTITPSKLAVGTDISKITATATGNMTLADVSVRDYDTYELLTTGQIQNNKNYYITYTFTPKSGYRVGNNPRVTLNTDYSSDYSYSANYISVCVYFSTCQKLSEVQVTLEGVEVGKSIANAQPQVPAGALYNADVVWYEDGSSVYGGNFEDGKKYEAWLFIYPQPGYTLDSKVEVTINGQTKTQTVGGMGTQVSIWETYSFLDPLEKIEIPALPTSIKKGQTLPTDFAAPADAPYTITAEWGIMNEGLVTTASKNASYVLHLSAVAKPGYEFTDDTQVFIGGEETQNYIPDGGTGIIVYRPYNVGVTEISRVDITATAPTTGAKPGTPTVSSTAKYELGRASWFYNDDGVSLEMDTVTTFEKGTYVYISPVLSAKSGYAFAEDVEVYVNGVKVDLIRQYHLGTIIEAIYLVGPVIDQPVKLEAPKVTVSGNTLTWEDNGAASYEIYRATSKSGKYTLLETVTAQEAATYALRAADLTFVDESATAGKTYYYKVKAISAAGSSYNSGFSAVSSVAYAFDAPTISVEINNTTGKTVITWEKISGAKSYDVYRATAPDGAYTKLGNTTSNTYTDTKAPAGTVYYYKVVTVGSSSVYNSEGSNIYESYAILAQPALKAAVDKATGKPALSWAAVADAVGYRVYRQLPGEAEFSLIKTQTELSFIDATAPLDTLCTYYIQAVAAEEFCSSAYSNQVTATVALGVPAPTGGVNVFGQPSFHWQLIEGAVKYEIYRSTSSTKGFTLVDTLEDGNAFCDEKAVAGTTYYYKVVALGQVSKSGESTAVKLTATCAIPELECTTDSSGKPALSWNKIDGASKGYEIYRSVDGGKFKKLKTVKTTTYVDTSAPIGSVCTYQVRALASKTAGNSQWSETATGLVICPAVTIKTAVDAATGKPSLSWSKATGATGYRIYRQLPGETEFTVLKEIAGVTFVDTTAPIDTECQYMVITLGKNEDLNSGFSKAVTVASGIARPAVKGGVDAITGRIQLSWEAVEGAARYEIYRSTSSTKGFTLMDTVEGLTFEDASAPGKTYYYKVVAIGQVSKSSESTAAKLTAICATPTLECATDLSGKPALSWTKIDGASKGYEIYRSVDGGKFKKLKTVKTTTYVDTSAPIGSACTYQVRALGSKSTYNSQWSETATSLVICSAVTLKTAVDAATGKPSLSWSKATSATAYRIFRLLPGETEFTIVAETTGTTFLDTTAPIDTECQYMVVTLGKTEGLNSGFSKAVTVVSGIARPAVQGEIDAMTGKFQLTWEAVEGAARYEVYRSTSSTKGFTLMDTVEGCSFEDASAPGKTYYYKVVAIGQVGKSAEPAALKLVGKCAQTTASAETDIITGKPVITWEAVSGAKKYEIWRATSENGKYTKVGTSTKTSYTDTKATVGNTYYYKVVAAGSKSTYNSPMSNVTAPAAAIPAQPVVTVKNDAKTGKLIASWKKVSGATQYKVAYMDITQYLEYDKEPTEEEILEKLQYVTTTKTSLTIPGTEPGSVYLVMVMAAPKNEEYCSIPSEVQYGAANCATPKIKGRLSEDFGYPSASWEEVEGAEVYFVYRSTKSNKGFELLGYVYFPSFVDTSAESGKTYYYKVTAVTEFTESAFSNVVKLRGR